MEELSAALSVPKEAVHRKLALWQQHGVLREESAGRYTVLETASSCKDKMERGAVMMIDSDDEHDSNTTTQTQQREEKMQVTLSQKRQVSLTWKLQRRLTSVNGRPDD